MTRITVVSTFTAIADQGKVDLGECDLIQMTVQEVKMEVELSANVPYQKQSLWWKGYILDQDDQSLLRACVGVNEGEVIDANDESLLLFMTIPVDTSDCDSSRESSRIRSPSLDINTVKQEIAKKGSLLGNTCTIS